MAHAWIQDTDGTGWAVSPLTGGSYGVSEQGLSEIEARGNVPGDGAISVLLVRRDNGPEEQWFLLARNQASVQVNGLPLVLGLRLLCDRDEIAVRGADSLVALHCFLSTERLAQVVPYPGASGAICCPRCKRPIEQNRLAVQCPNPSCGAWYHQEANLPCWTYSATCALCDQPTALDADFRWNPANL